MVSENVYFNNSKKVRNEIDGEVFDGGDVKNGKIDHLIGVRSIPEKDLIYAILTEPWALWKAIKDKELSHGRILGFSYVVELWLAVMMVLTSPKAYPDGVMSESWKEKFKKIVNDFKKGLKDDGEDFITASGVTLDGAYIRAFRVLEKNRNMSAWWVLNEAKDLKTNDGGHAGDGEQLFSCLTPEFMERARVALGIEKQEVEKIK